jgi:hypothetical protein
MNDKQLLTFEFIERKLHPYKISNKTVTDWPLFVDIKSHHDLPMNHFGVILIFCSFREGRYREITKEGWMKIMPTWNIIELETYINSKIFKESYKVDEKTCERIFQNGRIFGGAIRNIISSIHLSEDPQKMTRAALLRKGADVCDRFFKVGFGGTEDVISDLLIHRNPSVKENGSYDYNALSMTYNFASPYVLKELTALNKSGFVAAAKQKYMFGTFNGSEDGKEFEMLCFHSFPFSGLKFKITPLQNTVDLKEFFVTFPAIEYLPLNWRFRNDYLKCNVLYLPPYGNLEAVDAFCVMKILPAGKLTLINLQCTISPKHSIKMNGINIIYNAFQQNSNILIANSIIVFVIPSTGKLVAKQSIVNNAKVTALKIPTAIKSIENQQYKLTNNFGGL